jgi:hypothetical protein
MPLHVVCQDSRVNTLSATVMDARSHAIRNASPSKKISDINDLRCFEVHGLQKINAGLPCFQHAQATCRARCSTSLCNPPTARWQHPHSTDSAATYAITIVVARNYCAHHMMWHEAHHLTRAGFRHDPGDPAPRRRGRALPQ